MSTRDSKATFERYTVTVETEYAKPIACTDNHHRKGEMVSGIALHVSVQYNHIVHEQCINSDIWCIN